MVHLDLIPSKTFHQNQVYLVKNPHPLVPQETSPNYSNSSSKLVVTPLGVATNPFNFKFLVGAKECQVLILSPLKLIIAPAPQALAKRKRKRINKQPYN